MIDYLQREPGLPRLVALAWGGLVATSAAIAGGAAAANLIAKLGSPTFAAEWGPALGAATVEEMLKALGVVAIVLVAAAGLRSVVDGFVYGALVGLGFQVVENVDLRGQRGRAVAEGTDRVGPVVATFLLRGVLGGLWSHALFTAIAGAGIAYAVVNRHRSPGHPGGGRGGAARAGLAVPLPVELTVAGRRVRVRRGRCAPGAADQGDAGGGCRASR